MTPSPSAAATRLFGYSGRGFDDWMKPGQRGDLTQLIFVGPGSPNPSLNAWPKDWNNFGPAIGFAWQVPWFGAGQTTVRGGYQLSFLLAEAADVSIPSARLWRIRREAHIRRRSPAAPETGVSRSDGFEESVPVPVPVKPMGPFRSRRETQA